MLKMPVEEVRPHPDPLPQERVRERASVETIESVSAP